MTLKQSQDHQIYNDNTDSKQGYNHAQIERSCFNDVWEKANIKLFNQGNMSIISLEKCKNQK